MRTSRQSLTCRCKREVGREPAGTTSIPNFTRMPAVTKHARRLRCEMTEADRKLCKGLWRKQIKGIHFRRPHPVRPYALEFYSLALRLALEIDGGQRAEIASKQKDQRRTGRLALGGILAIRFWNNDALANLTEVPTELERTIKERPSPAISVLEAASTGASW